MKFSGTAIVLSALATLGSCNLSYEDSIRALSHGNVKIDARNQGEVWLNVSGFSPEKLPNIQRDLGIFSVDNAPALEVVASLAAAAAKHGKYGDLVYLYNVFIMNSHSDYIPVSSYEMQDGLMYAVQDKADKTRTDKNLVKLYAETSTTTELKEAYKKLTDAVIPLGKANNKRWTSEICSNAHQAAKSACQNLMSWIQSNTTIKSGGPRNICLKGCCVSWSANATFQFSDLYNAGNSCLSFCVGANVSCVVRGVSLQGQMVDQCVSNRANGCT